MDKFDNQTLDNHTLGNHTLGNTTSITIKCCDNDQIWLIFFSLVLLVLVCWMLTYCCRKRRRNRIEYDYIN